MIYHFNIFIDMNNDIERYQFWASELNNNSQQVQITKINDNTEIIEKLIDLEEEE